jgi:hypothetical protein
MQEYRFLGNLIIRFNENVIMERFEEWLIVQNLSLESNFLNLSSLCLGNRVYCDYASSRKIPLDMHAICIEHD